jgi:serine/threonine protein kinase
MSKLLSQGGFGCIYYPGIKCNGKPHNNKKIVSKLQKMDETAQNEISIGDIIMSIRNYELYFLPVVASCPVNIKAIDTKLLEECDSINKAKDKANDKDKQYVLMEVPYVKNKAFYTILIDMYSSKKHIIVGLIENYTYLLDAINILLEKSIVHFDIKSENILYNQNTHLPLLLDFGISIDMNTLLQGKKINTNAELEKSFYIYSPDYYIWCLEIHVINYLLNESTSSFQKENIKSISTEYVKYNKALLNFSDAFKANYLLACEAFLSRYIGMDKKKIITDLLSFYPTWDNYSLSVLYLKTFSFMFPHGFHKNSLILYFSQMLLYNIHPDPTKRYSLEETKEMFNDIFYMEEHVDNYIDFINTFDYDVDYTTQAIQADLHELKKTKAMMRR